MRANLRKSILLAAIIAGDVMSTVLHGQERKRPVVVASKPFGESYLLAEMFSQLLESRGFTVERRPGLGATEIAFGALRTNAIDAYPEYTGTGLIAILHDTLPDSVAADPHAVFAHVSRRFWELYRVPRRQTATACAH